MNKNDEKLEQDKLEEPMTVLARSLLTGFIGGILWGFLGVVLYYFNFSEVAPRSYMLRSWITADWTDSWLGIVLSVIMIGVLSILTAFIYYILFKKSDSIWMGIGYGFLLWGIVFYLLQPIFPNIPHVLDLNLYTIVSTICLYILYGTFIGYSISYDYNDTMHALRSKEDRQRNR